MPADILGSIWDEGEVDGWRGVWTRKPGTNNFHANFTHPTHGPIEGELSMTVNGNTVRIQRWNQNAPGRCEYNGTIVGGEAHVTYYCFDSAGNRLPASPPDYPWKH